MRRPRTEEELLDREAQRALSGIATVGQQMLTDLTHCSGLAEQAHKRPIATAVIASLAGAFLGRGAVQMFARAASSNWPKWMAVAFGTRT